MDHVLGSRRVICGLVAKLGLINPIVPFSKLRLRTKIFHQRKYFTAFLADDLFDSVVGDDVTTSKAIDRLLGVADQKQSTRFRLALRPVSFDLGSDAVRLQHHLRLQRIGILEFVDQQIRESTLKVGSQVEAGSFNPLAMVRQQVLEVQTAIGRFQAFVDF